MKKLYYVCMLCIQLLTLSSCERSNLMNDTYTLTSAFDSFMKVTSLSITEIATDSGQDSILFRIASDGSTIQPQDGRTFREACVSYGEEKPHIFHAPDPYIYYTPLFNARELRLESIDGEGKKHDLTPHTSIRFQSSRKFLESGYTNREPTSLYSYKLSELSPVDAHWINEKFTLVVPTTQLRDAKRIIIYLITDNGTISTSSVYPLRKTNRAINFLDPHITLAD